MRLPGVGPLASLPGWRAIPGAFTALIAGTVETLLLPENIGQKYKLACLISRRNIESVAKMY